MHNFIHLPQKTIGPWLSKGKRNTWYRHFRMAGYLVSFWCLWKKSFYPPYLFYFNLYFMYVGILPACVSVRSVSIMPSEARRRWVLGLKPVSGRATHALNFWAFSPAPEMFFCLCWNMVFLSSLDRLGTCYIDQAGLQHTETTALPPRYRD